MNKRDAEIQMDFQLPSVEEFNALRASVGWRLMSEHNTQTSLNGSLFCCCAREQGALLGFGRIVGDGAMYYYLQDVMIHPQRQNQGMGALIMEHLEAWLAKSMSPGSTAALLAAKDKEGFYLKYGYNIRPGKGTGPGMSKFVS